MLTSTFAAVLVASTLSGAASLTGPDSTPVGGASSDWATVEQDPTTTLVPLVHLVLGPAVTHWVDKTCPDTHPYVHKDRWIGTLPSGVTFGDMYGDPEIGYGMRTVWGAMLNWDPFTEKRVSIQLKCTSDASQSQKSRYPVS
ncbi:hypothetical protein [Agromyces silvae]|uniref:hypothetical protein n=1 Tax=Agromyces silvae TaxID=3388266 RepID=UPI00280ACB48|nr:hypothetical protein [Agromyces protaetiae]